MSENTDQILTIRSHSGMSGDMLLTGLAVLNMLSDGVRPDSEEGDALMGEVCRKILPDLAGTVKIRARAANGILGWHAEIDLPHEREHRHLADILKIIDDSQMAEAPRAWARAAFDLLAEAEAAAHGVDISEVHFHEVGALDSVLDVCAVCELFARLNPLASVCGPLPLADGGVSCAHGVLPAPAPAVLRLLSGLPVKAFEGSPEAGELITPTAAALLHSLPVKFGGWPTMRVRLTCLAYGSKYFPDAPNGLIFALGEPLA
ncbi:MAG: LarC family nickel insertion protein [Desulfovibrio sp.]|nr:LarC family nickel insertion protein [Desulfovibrio sp.]